MALFSPLLREAKPDTRGFTCTMNEKNSLAKPRRKYPLADKTPRLGGKVCRAGISGNSDPTWAFVKFISFLDSCPSVVWFCLAWGFTRGARRTNAFAVEAGKGVGPTC